MPPGAHWFAQLSTPFPEPPAEIRNDQAALQQWFQSPEIQALARRVKQAPVGMLPDGSFVAESVSAGDYRLRVALLPPPPKAQANGVQPMTTLLSGKAELTVPADPAVGEINLGEVATEPPSAPAQ